MKPCLTCGEPCETGRCDAHRDPKPSARARGYNTEWDKLSRRARKMQPFCTFCGSTQDLQCDHTPEAWRRKAQGKSIRIRDVQVLCGDCNRAAGAARGPQTRGEYPPHDISGPEGSRNFHHTPTGRSSGVV